MDAIYLGSDSCDSKTKTQMRKKLFIESPVFFNTWLGSELHDGHDKGALGPGDAVLLPAITFLKMPSRSNLCTSKLALTKVSIGEAEARGPLVNLELPERSQLIFPLAEDMEMSLSMV